MFDDIGTTLDGLSAVQDVIRRYYDDDDRIHPAREDDLAHALLELVESAWEDGYRNGRESQESA